MARIEMKDIKYGVYNTLNDEPCLRMMIMDEDDQMFCEATGSFCTGQFCEDYGCAKEAGIFDGDDDYL